MPQPVGPDEQHRGLGRKVLPAGSLQPDAAQTAHVAVGAQGDGADRLLLSHVPAGAHVGLDVAGEHDGDGADERRDLLVEPFRARSLFARREDRRTPPYGL